ncbi:uncharacterized protein Z520_10322 [Fonsecaea multimorphosa CBS 102226]|uniref:Indoleamine 2,3-dioxygenase n=1 Tax=Fonsecaea multimorphosa CBS 102226 TaxID=1442371 RepID=A0A0D2GWL0_9EURO|nr:uncharacterized protein Z520_10322 [Fonsecaea multimorphosa CBS 102226]KIX93985.1 hypothetical protein Z520_10322 [Fonsecaea multimorphosa CBS 102226]OAL19332.1 hypothetical protein AYO22_09876 [Fonsecaea multimorphosa]
MSSLLSLPNPRDYDVDFVLGFVSTKPTELPGYYAPWCELLLDLPHLLQAKTLKAQVNNLETLATDHLLTSAHWQRAYVVLGFLTQGFVWQEKSRPSQVIPASLAEPFLDVCNYLGMKPVLSYVGLCLWNWMQREEDIRSPPLHALANFQDIKSYASFTGTRDEDAFYLVPVMVEAQGAKLIKLMLDTIAADQNGEILDLVSSLDVCVTTLTTMRESLSVLDRYCEPIFFFEQIRPMLGGSVGAEEKGLPDGVALERSDGSRIVVKCAGGSAGQSSLFQFLDHMFGVRHESKMLLEMRAYMPKKHREFLEAVELMPSLRDMVERRPEDQDLRCAFHGVIDAFQKWRTKHVILVSRFVVQPAAAVAKGRPAGQQRGTAGSQPMPFLKQYRDETVFRLQT